MNYVVYRHTLHVNHVCNYLKTSLQDRRPWAAIFITAFPEDKDD